MQIKPLKSRVLVSSCEIGARTTESGIHLLDDDILVLDTLKYFMSILNESEFIRVHKSFIIPIKKIENSIVNSLSSYP